MTHFIWILGTFNIYEVDERTHSVLFTDGQEVLCEINGTPFDCQTRQEFWELVEMFGEEDFTE